MKAERFRPTSALHKEKAPKQLGFVVIICSTSRYSSIKKGEKVSDPTGELAVRLIKNSGHIVRIKKIVPDDKGMISKAVKDALFQKGVDVIITSGGTGIAPSDVTIEAINPFLEKELLGFGELLRQLSYKEIGSSAILTRALAGVAKGKAIFCLPGSPHAVELALKELILSESPHIVVHARGK